MRPPAAAFTTGASTRPGEDRQRREGPGTGRADGQRGRAPVPGRAELARVEAMTELALRHAPRGAVPQLLTWHVESAGPGPACWPVRVGQVLTTARRGLARQGPLPTRTASGTPRCSPPAVTHQDRRHRPRSPPPGPSSRPSGRDMPPSTSESGVDTASERKPAISGCLARSVWCCGAPSARVLVPAQVAWNRVQGRTVSPFRGQPGSRFATLAGRPGRRMERIPSHWTATGFRATAEGNRPLGGPR